MSKIYVVYGYTGSHEDLRDWPVKAFKCEDRALEFVGDANAISKQIFEHNLKLQPKLFEPIPDTLILKHPMDPDYYDDGTGAKYFYYLVELE